MGLALAAGLALAGCKDENKQAQAEVDASCSSPLASQLIGEITLEAVEARVRGLNRERPDGRRIDPAKVNALGQELRFEVVDVLTTRNDPNSTKKFCEAHLVLRVPTTTLAQAGQTREALGLPDIRNQAEDAGFKVDPDKFTKSIVYSVQPTDDRQKLYLRLENADELSDLSGEILLSAAIQVPKRAHQASIDDAYTAPAAAPSRIANLDAEQEAGIADAAQEAGEAAAAAAAVAAAAAAEAAVQGVSEEAQAIEREYTALEREINVVWRALPPEVREANLVAQRRFNAKKESVCQAEAHAAAPGEFELVKQRCWSRHYRQRLPVLRALAGAV